MKYTNKTLRTSRTLREAFVSAVIAMAAAVAVNTARAEALEDSWWAGGGSGTWGGANWFYTMRHSNLEFTEGKTAYFTNETCVIDLGGRTFDVYTMRNPLADGARVSVTVTNGTLSLRLASDSSDGDDALNFKNFDLIAGAGANIVNANETRGYRFSNNAHVVVGAGATLTETTSETSSSLHSIIGMGSASTSNSLTVAGTATFQRRLYIDGDDSATASPTGIVRVVSGGVLNANDSLRIGVNYASDNGATSGYGLLEIEQGGTVNALNGMWMGGKWSDSKNLYALSELRVGGTLNVTGDIFFGEGSPDITVRKVTIDGGKVDLTGGIKLESNDRARSVSFNIKNGGEIALTSLQFDTWSGEHSYNFDGGTIKAKASFETPAPTEGIKTTVTVSEGGFVFDTQEYNVIFRQGIYYGSGTFTKKGSGYFEFNYVPTFPGTIDVSEGMVGLAGSSAKFPGAITVRSGAAFKKTSAFASEQDASFTLEAGATLQPYQSSASAAPTAIQAQSFTLPATGTVTIRLGDDGANTAPAGAYPVVTILGEGVFTQDDLAKFTCTSGDAVKSFSLSSDGKSIVLNVGATGACTWTGAAGDGLFSTEGNWAGGVKPTAGGTTPLVFAANGGIVTNDIGTLSPAYINFEAALGETGIDIRPKEAEGYGFTALGSVTNSVAYDSVTISAPVVYSAAIDVSTLGGKRVLFSGGVTGSAPVNHNYFFGRYTITDASWTPASNACIPDGSVLTAKAVLNPNGLQINAGGKLVADSVTDNDGAVGTMTPVFKSNKGDIEIKGLLSLAKSNIFIYNDNAVQTGVLRAKGIDVSGTDGSSVWMRLQSWASGKTYYGATFAVGSEGFKFTSNTATRYHLSASENTANSVTYIYADEDFSFAKKSSNTSGDLTSDPNAKLVLVTREYDDETAAHTITVNGMFTGGMNVEVCGPGTVKFDSSTSTYTGGTTVKDTATLAFGSVSAKPGSGPVTLYAGTTLQIPLPTTSSDAVSLGTALAFSGTGTITLKLGDGTEAIAPGRYNLFTTTSAHAADVLQRFTLANPTEGGVPFSFSGNSGNNTVRLFVGSDTASATAENCLWTGAAGDGKFSTAANWQGGRRPQDVGSTAAVFFNYGGGKVTNDVENLVLSSITFGQNAQLYEICGKPISGVSTIANNVALHHILNVKVTCASGTPTLALGNSTYLRYDGGLVCEQLPDVVNQRYSGKITMTGNTRWTSKTSGISDTQTIDDGAETVLTVPNVQLNHFTINSGTTVRADQWYKSGNDRNDGNSKPKDYYQLITWMNSGKLRVREIKTGGDCRLYTSNGTSSGIIIVDGVLHAVSQASKSYNGTTRYMYVYLHPRAANSSANWAIGANGLGFGTSTACEYYVESGKTANIASFADWHIANNPRSATQLSLAVFGTLNLDTSHYATGEEEGDVPASHTVTLDGYLKSTGTINITGPGKFVINRTTTSDTTGAVNVKDAATLAINAGMKYFGPVNLNGASSFLAPQANTGTAQIGGALTLNSGTSLVVSNLTAGTTAVSVGSVTADGASLVIEGDPLADGDYTVLSAGSNLSDALPGKFTLGGSAITGKAASLSVNGANLVLTIAGEGAPAAPFHVWTGAGEDANFSTAANWQSGAAPVAGDGKGIFFPSSSGAIVNDIPGLTPQWMTFGIGVGETTLSGEEFTGVVAVTNLSTTVSPVLEAAVRFAGNIQVKQSAMAEKDDIEKAHVTFAGGAFAAPGCAIENGNAAAVYSRCMFGDYHFATTEESQWSALYQSSQKRNCLAGNSTLHLPYAGSFKELYIGNGSAVTTGVMKLTANDDRISWQNWGEFVITNELILTGTGDRFAGWTSLTDITPVFKIEKATTSMTANWMYFSQSGAGRGTYYIGKGGFNFSSSSAAGAYCIGYDNADSYQTIRPWYGDFTIGTRGTSDKDLVCKRNVTFCTDDENGVGRTITLDGKLMCVSVPALTVSGRGVLCVNSANVNSEQPPVSVVDTVTLKFGNAAASIGTGPVTMAAGTTLAVPAVAAGDTPVILGSSFAVDGEGKVKLVIGDGSGLAVGDHAVFLLTETLPEGYAGMFDLMNTTAEAATFYSPDGRTLRISVGGPQQLCVWTGAAGDGNFSTPGNWSPAFVPMNGSDVLIPSASGTIVNDIANLSLHSITFGADIGELTLDGNVISGVAAITNLSTAVTPVLNTPVAFSGNVNYTTAATWDTSVSPYRVVGTTIDFAGGATGTAVALATNKKYLKGDFELTGTASGFSAPVSGNDRTIISTNSTLTATAADCGNTHELFIMPDAALIVSNKTVSADQRAWCWNMGRFIVLDTYSLAYNGNHYLGYTGDTVSYGFNSQNLGSLWAKKISLDGTGSQVFWLGNNSASATYKDTAYDIYIGEGGMRFGESSQGTYATPVNCFARIHPWGSDFTIMTRPTGHASGLSHRAEFYTNGDTEFVTTDADGETPRTITMDGIFRQNGSEAGKLVMSGNGTFVQNGEMTETTKRTGALEVKDTATLKFGNSAAFIGTGPVTMAAGTTLAVPLLAAEAEPVELGSSLVFAGEGSVGLVIGDGSTLADGDYPVVKVTGSIASDFAARFSLANATESAATLYSVDGKTIRLAVGAVPDTGSCVWTGGTDDKFSTVANWLGGRIPSSGADIVINAGVAGVVDNDLGALSANTITFAPSSAPVTITGGSFTGVAAVTNLSAAVQTLSNEVSFASTYLVHCESATVKFAGGATATYPDAAITSDTLATHTLDGVFNFTADWTIPDQPSGRPFIVGENSVVTGKVVAAVNYQNANYHLRIDSGAKAVFDTVNVSAKLVFYLNGGDIIAKGNVNLGGADKRDFCYYGAANTGTVVANGIYKNVTSVGLIYHYARNMVVGSGGFGMYRKDYSIQFCADSKLTATDDLAIHQPISGDGPKDGDWGLQLNGKTFTIDTAGHTVTFDSAIHGSAGKIVKEGEGEMIMQSRQKIHNNTEVKGGKLTIKLTSAAGNGPITVSSGATLRVDSTSVSLPGALTMAGGSTLEVPQVASGATPVTVGTTFTRTGDGKVNITLGDGSALEDGDYGVFKITGSLPEGCDNIFELTNPNSGTVNFYTTDGKTLRVAVGSYNGPCVWTGEGNGYSFSDSANWLMGKRPDTDGCDIVLSVQKASGLVNDLGALRPASIAIAAGSAMLGLDGDAISGLGNVVNHSSEQVLFYTPVQFATTYNVVQNGKVTFLGGATATHPDVSLRTTTATANTRTLYGDFTFTEDWTIEGIGTGNDYPWIVPSGTTVRGKLLTGTQNNHMRILRIDNGGYALFTTVTNGWDRGDIDIDGTLEVTGEMIVRTDPAAKGTASKFGRSGNTGTVKAWRIAKCEHCTAQSFIPNLVVGAGGLGAVEKDYSFLFDVDTTVTATDSFECHGVKHGSNFYDWGLNISSGKTVTFNVGEGMTVTCGVGVQGGGSIRKTGAGTLLMTDTYNGSTGFTKTYTGTTTVAEGTLRFAAGQLGTGAVTVSDGGRLEVASGTTLSNALTVNDGGELAITGSGTATLSGAVTLNEGTTLEFAISGASNSAIAFSSAPTGAATVKFAPGFNPTPGSSFTLATGVGECTFTLDPKYGGSLNVDEGSNLIYRSRDYFYIRVTDASNLMVNPSWLIEKGMSMKDYEGDAEAAQAAMQTKMASTAPNGNTYMMNYILDYDPEDKTDTLFLSDGSETATGWRLSCSFKVNELLELTGGNLVMKTSLIGSSDAGKNYSDVPGCTTNITCVAGKAENISFDIPSEVVGGGLHFFA